MPPFLEFSRSLLPRPRRLMLLVNPFSGRGQAMQWCQTHILPMVREANISYNLIQTGKMYAHKAKIKACWDEHGGWLKWVPWLTADSFERVPYRASEPCKGAHQRNFPPRMGWHHYHLWRRPAAWGLHCISVQYLGRGGYYVVRFFKWPLFVCYLLAIGD